MEGAIGAAVELGGGFGVLVGSTRSFLDGEGATVLRGPGGGLSIGTVGAEGLFGGLGSHERTHRMLSGHSEVGVVVCNGGNFSGFVWVSESQKWMSGGTGLAWAIGGYWARVGEWHEVWRGGRGLSNEVVAQTEDSGLFRAVAVSAGEGEG